MGEGVNHLAEHNAPEAVDVVREQPTQHALVAEQIDQRNPRQHRRRHQRQQGNPAPDAFARNQRALQRVGKQVGQRYDNGGDAEGNFQAVAEQPVEIGAGHQLFRREPATTLPGVVAEAAPEDRQQRQQHRDAEQQQQKDFAADDKNAIADLGFRGLSHLLVRKRQREIAVHQANTWRLRGGKATMICCAPRRGIASGATSASSAWPGS